MQAFGAWLREPEVYAKYHKGFNKNDNIQLTPWKLDGRSYNREVVAYLPVKAPAWFRKAIGMKHCPSPCPSTSGQRYVMQCLAAGFLPHWCQGRLEAS